MKRRDIVEKTGVQEVKRMFTINSALLKEFKKISKQESKTYKRAMAEAIVLWLEDNRKEGFNNEK